MNSVSVLVTHMDIEKEWSQKEFEEALNEDLGIENSVYSASTTNGDQLLKNILDVCNETYHLDVSSESFLRLFKISNSNWKVLKVTEDIIIRFKSYKECFDFERNKFSRSELMDLYFEFKAFMGQQIEVAKKEMSAELDFDFLGEQGVSQAGHLANMVNQLRAIIYDVRAEALAYQNDHGVSELRRCPFCNTVWAKVEGCDGQTTCGSRPSNAHDLRDPNVSVLATFTFDITTKLKLRILRNGSKGMKKINTNDRYYGCGKSIVWNEMPKVEVPKDFQESTGISTDDIMSLPVSARTRSVYRYIKEGLEKSTRNMTRRLKL